MSTMSVLTMLFVIFTLNLVSSVVNKDGDLNHKKVEVKRVVEETVINDPTLQTGETIVRRVGYRPRRKGKEERGVSREGGGGRGGGGKGKRGGRGEGIGGEGRRGEGGGERGGGYIPPQISFIYGEVGDFNQFFRGLPNYPLQVNSYYPRPPFYQPNYLEHYDRRFNRLHF